MPPQSDSQSTSLFPTGSKFLISGGSFVQNNDANKVLNPLYEKVSPNAILNKGGRADEVRCYPGTRKEVMEKIEKWRRANHSEGCPIFWLSGPAGAGKSAIVQTIAERCLEDKVPMANFFFFRADGTRNHSEPVVTTLLFQLFESFPALKAHVMDIADSNPVIFRQSIRDQFLTLLETPLRAIQQASGQSPPVVLIDGLDECSSEYGKAEQTSLLRIIHDITTKPNPAFIALVASRTEAHLTMAFTGIGISPDSIYLDDSYRPLHDIRLFLISEFERIRTTHGLKTTLDVNWPPRADFDSILNKSSGQFVYAATVTRFIADSAASPKRSLEIVLGLRPPTKTSPFATLDSLYTYILSQADDWRSVHDILAAQKVGDISSKFLTNIILLGHLDYTEDDILSNFSELTAIIRFKPGDKDLTLFHASLDDFLYDRTRAGMFYVDINSFACKLVPLTFKNANTFWQLTQFFDFLQCVHEPNDILDQFLISYVPNLEPDTTDYNLYDRLANTCLHRLEKVYQSRDFLLYRAITNHWQGWFDNLNPTSKEAQRNGHNAERHSPEHVVSKQSTLAPPAPLLRRRFKFPWKKRQNP